MCNGEISSPAYMHDMLKRDPNSSSSHAQVDAYKGRFETRGASKSSQLKECCYSHLNSWRHRQNIQNKLRDSQQSCLLTALKKKFCYLLFHLVIILYRSEIFILQES